MIKTTLTVVAGAGGLIALVVAYRRQRINEQEYFRAEAAEGRENTKLFNERFATASEQLGHEKAAVRLAGVYALGGLADDWKAHQQTCIDVLCAYLRMSTDSNDSPVAEAEGEKEVRRTILRVIADHLRESAPVSWCGRNFDFSGAALDGGDLTGVRFTGGKVYFRNVQFTGERFSFQDAQFSGARVSFDGAHFGAERVSFHRAKFLDGNVSFNESRFMQGRVFFSNAWFNGGEVSFARAQFIGDRVSFHEARFGKSVVSFAFAQFPSGKVSFQGINQWAPGKLLFSDASFSGATVSFDRARFDIGKLSFHNARFLSGAVSFRDVAFKSDDVHFRSDFAGGYVIFDGSKFLKGSKVSFDFADFVGSEVSFVKVEFVQATVDLSNVRMYDMPPRFDAWDRPPAGLLLPTAGHLSDGVGSDTGEQLVLRLNVLQPDPLDDESSGRERDPRGQP